MIVASKSMELYLRENFINLIYYEAEANLVLGLALE